MKPLLALLILAACSNPPLLAVVSYTGGTYSQNFDGEHATAWVQDSTLPGWFAYQGGGVQANGPDPLWAEVSVLSKGTGQSNFVGFLNLGTSDTTLNRSLGSRNASDDITFALVLRNDTLTTFTDFTLSYFGEQWEINTTDFTPSQTLQFSFGVFPTFAADHNDPYNRTVVPQNGGQPTHFYDGYTRPAGGALDVSAFRFSGVGTPLDGTAPENRRLITSTEAFVWEPDEYLVLRWFDDATTAQPNAKLALNDLQFEAHAIPEPSVSFLALVGSALVGLWRRRENAPAFR
jgi:hypothetical protein